MGFGKTNTERVSIKLKFFGESRNLFKEKAVKCTIHVGNTNTRKTTRKLARQHQDVDIIGGNSCGNGGPFTIEENCR